MSAIRDAADTFAGISRVKDSSSALQARFLQRIVTKMSRASISQNSNSTALNNSADGIASSTSFINHTGAQGSDSTSLDMAFSDSGSWDDIFASSGLNVANNMFMF